jgi:hypothetical protein
MLAVACAAASAARAPVPEGFDTPTVLHAIDMAPSKLLLTLRQSLHCFRLALWDEDAKRLIGFRELRRAAPVGA